MAKRLFHAVGSVLGSCGHKHVTPKAAAACSDRDAATCKRAGGYSDRSVRAIDGTPLTDEEFRAIYSDYNPHGLM